MITVIENGLERIIQCTCKSCMSKLQFEGRDIGAEGYISCPVCKADIKIAKR